MTRPEIYKMETTDAPPTRLMFTVVEGDSRLGISPGDSLEWDGAAPADQRLTLRRAVNGHPGTLDGKMLRSQIVPIGLTILEARQALVAQLLADRAAA